MDQILQAIKSVRPEMNRVISLVKDKALSREELQREIDILVGRITPLLPDYGQAELIILQEPSNWEDYIDRYPEQSWPQAILAWGFLPDQIKKGYGFSNLCDLDKLVSTFISSFMGNRYAEMQLYYFYKPYDMHIIRPKEYKSRLTEEEDPRKIRIHDLFYPHMDPDLHYEHLRKLQDVSFIPIMREKIKRSLKPTFDIGREFLSLYETYGDMQSLYEYVKIIRRSGDPLINVTIAELEMILVKSGYHVNPHSILFTPGTLTLEERCFRDVFENPETRKIFLDFFLYFSHL